MIWKGLQLRRPMSFITRVLFFLLVPVAARGQEAVRAYRQIALESGRGTLALKKAYAGQFYVLNANDKCVWMFSETGATAGRVSSVGMGPSDLLAPKDIAADSKGNIVVADASGAGTVKVLSPTGELLLSIPFHAPAHVGALSDGRILVSGFPKDSLISVFDSQGRSLPGIGALAEVDGRPFFNSVLNMGVIAVDRKDNIYYCFIFMLTPTIRKYDSKGTLLAEWHLKDGDALNEILAAARKRYEERRKAGETGSGGGIRILTSASFDEDSKTLWVASGPQVTQLDASGDVLRIIKLVRPDGRPLPADGLNVDGGLIRAASFVGGIFEFPKPL